MKHYLQQWKPETTSMPLSRKKHIKKFMDNYKETWKQWHVQKKLKLLVKIVLNFMRKKSNRVRLKHCNCNLKVITELVSL